jgi:hypothetical protein
MTEFMNNDIVNHRFRDHHELPIKVEITFPGAAPPAGLRPFDNYPVAGYSQKRTEFGHLFLDQYFCLLPEPPFHYQA